MARSLVTGGAGFIGAHLARSLSEAGSEVVVLDDLSGGFGENVPSGCTFIEGSILDVALIDGLFDEHRFERVYHCAAYAAEGLSHFIKRFNFENNVIGSINLINAAVNFGTDCFVFTSSIAVYGAGQVPLRESTPPTPEDSYGIAKYAVEQELAVSHEMFGLDYVVFRPHNVYGELQNIGDRYRNVLGIFINQILRGEPLSIFGDGEQTRAFSYVGDIVPAIAHAPDTPGARGEVFNVGADTPYSINTLADVVRRAMGVPDHPVRHLPARNEVVDAFSDHSKVRDVFGDSGSTTLADGVERMVRWARGAGAREPSRFSDIEIRKNLPPVWAEGAGMSEEERPLRLLWLGTYERDYTRTRVLMAGLRELGVEVLECHRPLWELTRHKAGSFLSPKGLPRIAGQVLGAWASIASAQRRFAGVDAVVAGYPHQPDALPAAVFARGRRVPLVVDAMISMSDTLAGDRARVGAGIGHALAALDTATLRCADVVIADTSAHARYYESRFGVPAERIGVARLGAETDVFRPAPAATGTPRALFYGKLAPLHGLETLLEAARVPGTPPVRLVGDGQLGGWLADELRRDAPEGFEHVPWIEHERLGEELARAGICLGVFGRSEKAARVVPNKVYHAMSVGRPVITADTPAAREVLEHERNALLVPPGDAPALAAAMTRLGEDEELRKRLGEAARERFVDVASQTVVARDFLTALKRSPRLSERAAARVPVDGA